MAQSQGFHSYHPFMKMYSQEHGMSSFFGSDKKHFLDSWKTQKKINKDIQDGVRDRVKTNVNRELLKIYPAYSEKRKAQQFLAKKRDSMAKLREERKAAGLSASGKSKK
jgi:hypothetical protein